MVRTNPRSVRKNPGVARARTPPPGPFASSPKPDFSSENAIFRAAHPAAVVAHVVRGRPKSCPTHRGFLGTMQVAKRAPFQDILPNK